jgi:hypothetical protein
MIEDFHRKHLRYFMDSVYHRRTVGAFAFLLHAFTFLLSGPSHIEKCRLTPYSFKKKAGAF